MFFITETEEKNLIYERKKEDVMIYNLFSIHL